MNKPYRALLAVAGASLVVCILPTSAFAAGPAAINLGTAGNFTILAKTGVSTTGSTVVVGDIGVSPAAATYITGFALTLPAAGAFSTSALVTGKVYAPGYADPTPAVLTTAVGDMETAYTDGAGRTNPTATELGAGNIGGMTFAPGLYKWGTGVTIPTDVTLSGSASDVWIFQIAQGLDISSGKTVILSGGAKASNIFWVVAGQTTIGTNAVFNGNILGQTAIVLNTGATLTGRALAQTAVTLDSNSVTTPSTSSSAVSPSPATVNPPANSATVSPTTPAGSLNANAATTTTTPVYTGCISGNKFSTTTGRPCTSASSSASPALPAASLFGQQIRAIATNLFQGSRGASVTTLQQFLISEDKGPAAGALAVASATGYFGVLTRAALAEFQADAGISPPQGYFGPITRAYVSAHN